MVKQRKSIIKPILKARAARWSLALLALAFLGVEARAVGTSHWIAGNEADFKKGILHNVVATNLGDLKLSRAVKTILEQDAQVSTVNALAEAPDGSIYAGTGPEGILLRITGDKVTTVAVLRQNTNITALAFDPAGRLLVATAGDRGRILRFDHPARLTDFSRQRAAAAEGKEAPVASEKPTEIFSADGVQYVWAMQQTPDGKLYAATGPNGQLFEIDADGHSSVLFKSDENNLLSMLSDGKDLLYIGTDPNGLIYRVNRKTKNVFVLFNAPESEVDCLVLDAKGNLYAGTGQAQPGEEQKTDEDMAEKEKVGRPEGTTGAPLPGIPPQSPNPPALPDPNPGEPNPIPKSPATAAPTSRSIMLYWPTGHGAHSSAAMLVSGASSSTSDPCGVASLIIPPRTALLLDDPNGPGDEPAPPDNPPSQPSPPGVPVPGKKSGKTPASGPVAMPQPDNQAINKPHVEGNAIYRIAPDGFVKEIFRQPDMVLSMLEDNGTLLVGTGGEGVIYQVNPAAEETVALAKADPKEIMALLRLRDGRVLMGLADVGAIASLSNGYSPEGTFTSPVLDAAQISLFGKIHLDGSLPPGTTLTVATRSGNVQDASKAGWSDWSNEISAAEYVKRPTPNARFLQYRLTMKTEDAKVSPVVRLIDVAYQLPNMAPVIKGIKIAAKAEAENPNAQQPGEAGPAHPVDNRIQAILWEAEDPDGDAIQYSLYFRLGSDGPWVLLKDKLTDAHFEWDTRTVADGRYFVKVVASNAAANPPGTALTGSRVSELLVIDNTPPVIGDVKSEVKGASARISARIVDRTSIVAACDYSVDSNTDWQAVLPSDKIYDSPEAAVSFSVNNLSPGDHQVTLRATDSKGNQAFQTVILTVGNAATKPGGSN